ncbi:TorD/DmsD family molecular chaperone [Dickeya dianthicola]|uniref:TorD/DmsD family molecular chaperone n=1 Tax=Dickeya dianthicola TaxID=204039 RepID=UPI001867F2ED|nr:molecular chaperone TorD family protein [Dickeya dianthicola]QOL13432.1 molecular chaperone TorD family protein [Dickeya dianthicola]
MDYLLIRHYIYDLLRRFFIEEPSVNFLTFLQQGNTAEIIHSQLPESPAITQQYQACINALSNKNISENSDDYHGLHWDFTQLFIGPHTLPAPPWESSYKNDRLLFTETTNEVEQYYQRYGFHLSKKEYEAADHIGFELDFIYHLSQKPLSQEFDDINNLRDGLNGQGYFLNNHLLSFIDTFTTNIAKNAQTDFYKNLASFTAEFVKFDAKKIESILLQF